MGNSQGAQLRPTSPFSSSGDSRGFGARKHFKERRRWSGGASKFAAPENRVLPPPVAGQRLRTTNNGHILQNGGTISGRKLAMLAQERERRNESSFEDDLNESGDTTGPDTPGARSKMLYGHKKSHSDPDIIHSMIRNDIVGESEHNLSKSIIAVSPSKAKIKSRKKTRAPDPPLSNTLPRDLDKIPMFGHYRKSGRIKMKSEPTVVIKAKSPAPPPPPPLPSGPNAMDQQSAVYEKNKRGPSKWKMSKSSSDIREEKETPIVHSPSRPAMGRMDLHRKSYGDIETKTNQVLTIFDTRNSYNAKLAEHIKPKSNDASKKDKPNLNKSFQEEIMAAVKKKSGLHESNLKGTTPPISRVQIRRNEPMKTTWNVNLRKRDEDKQSEPDYEDVEEPITYCINEERYNQQPLWKSENRPVDNRAKSPRFVRNDQARSSQIDLCLTRDLKPDWKETSQTEHYHKEKMKQVHSQIKIGITETDLRRHTEQQKDLKLVKTRENGKWIMENTQDKLSKSPTIQHQGLWANNKYPVDVENRHSLAKEIYLQQEQQKRARNLNQIENNLYSKDTVVDKDGSCSESEYSSSSDSLKDQYEIGALMRPTLPRKSMEIPQFSPTQAWKSLVIDQPPTSYLSDLSSDEGEINEEKIRQFQKPIAPRRSTVERCTDSGISPDAGSPLPNHEHRELPLHQQTRKPGVGRNASPPPPIATTNWIPQQDLLDDSDLGSVDQYNQQGANLKNHHFWAETNAESGQQTKQSFPYGIFSGRQPTEIDGTYQLKIPVEKQKSRDKKKNKTSNGGQHFNSLRSLKRVFGLKMKVAEEPKGIDTNWSLSRSTPVINNDADKTLMGKMRHSPSENMLHSKSKIERVDSKPRSDGNMEYHIDDEEPLSLNVKSQMKNELIKENKITKMKKKNKFSYQNTIRKEEKKKMEEKLNQEVAMREQRREKEIQWMNKVEEEFRKRRDREKINIRYQLKMLNDEDASFEWDPTDIPMAERESRSLPYIPLHSPTTVNKINSSPIQKQVKKESYHMNESTDLRTPSTTASSPDIPQWPQSTGMSKWLRKKKSQKPQSNNKQKPHNGPMSPPRPEPEGGRSSGDEHKSMEAVKEKCEPPIHSLTNYHKNSTVYKQETPRTLVNEISISNVGNMTKNPTQNDLIRAFAEGHSIDSDCMDNFITSVEKQVKTNLANNGHTFQSHARYNAKQVENMKVPKNHSEILNNHYLQMELSNGFNNKPPTKDPKKCAIDNSDGGVFARGHPHRSGGRAKVAPLKLSPENNGYFPQPYSPNKGFRSIPFDVVFNGDANRDSSSAARHNAPQDLRTAVEAR